MCWLLLPSCCHTLLNRHSCAVFPKCRSTFPLNPPPTPQLTSTPPFGLLSPLSPFSLVIFCPEGFQGIQTNDLRWQQSVKAADLTNC